VYGFSKAYDNFVINANTGVIRLNQSLEDNRSWMSNNPVSGSTAQITLLVEVNSGKVNSLHRMEDLEMIIDLSCCRSLITGKITDQKNDPLSGIVLAGIIAAIALALVVGAIGVLACVFNRTKNGAPQGSISGSPTHESFNNYFNHTPHYTGFSPESTPAHFQQIQHQQPVHIYPNHHGHSSYVKSDKSDRSASSGRGSVHNDEDTEIKLINERNYLQQAKTPDFLVNQPDSGFTEQHDNISLDSMTQNIAEVVYGDDEPHVYASASIESVHPWTEESGRNMTSLINSKLHEIGADQFDPARAMQAAAGGSFNSLVGKDLHDAYNWDYLLGWGPQYQHLAPVFSDIAKLKNEQDTQSPDALPRPPSRLYNKTPTSTTPPPKLINVMQSGSGVVHPVATKMHPQTGFTGGVPIRTNSNHRLGSHHSGQGLPMTQKHTAKNSHHSGASTGGSKSLGSLSSSSSAGSFSNTGSNRRNSRISNNQARSKPYIREEQV
jgi:hypothetical protein